MLEKIWNSRWFQTFVAVVIAVIIILVILRLAMESVMIEIVKVSDKQDQMFAYLIKKDSIQDAKQARFPGAPLSLKDMTKVSSVYSYRKDPKTGEWEFHQGVDYRASRGTIVYAAATGIIKEVGWDNGYGNKIKIDHGNGYKTSYSHLMNMVVIPGEFVNQGDTIGNVGSTGYTTGPHLHYEVTYTDTLGIETKINPDVFTAIITQ